MWIANVGVGSHSLHARTGAEERLDMKIGSIPVFFACSVRQRETNGLKERGGGKKCFTDEYLRKAPGR